MQLLLAHKAAAAAIEAEIKARVTRNYAEEGSADTWRLPGGLVTANLSTGGAEIVDRPAFLSWLALRHPTEVERKLIRVTEVRNDRWLKQLLGRLVPMDPEELEPGEGTPCVEDSGEIIPGVVWRAGDRLVSVSIRPDADITRRLAAVATDYADGKRDMPGLALTQTSSPVYAEGTQPSQEDT